MNDNLKELLNQKDEILRNITLHTNDIKDNLLSEHFYNRTDISEQRKNSLKQIEEKIKNT